MATDRYEIERLRRSIVMLSPGAPALDREEALTVMAELQEAQTALRELRRALARVLDYRDP
jgi:hypothetical protein